MLVSLTCVPCERGFFSILLGCQYKRDEVWTVHVRTMAHHVVLWILGPSAPRLLARRTDVRTTLVQNTNSFMSLLRSRWYLAVVLVAYVGFVASLRPGSNFGQFHDDSMYFASAKALADGRGYVIPSLPGIPPQTKYPIFYPWLLSGVWKWWPSFPDNLQVAGWIAPIFGCWFLLATYVLLRKIIGIEQRVALFVTSFCCIHPLFLNLSGSLLSDVPFMAFALTATIAAEFSFRDQKHLSFAFLAGTFAGLSIITRTVGLAVLAGILAAALGRRKYLNAGLFCLMSLPFLASLVWFGMQLRTGASAPHFTFGWRETLLYYTSYLEFWRLDVPDLGALWALLKLNSTLLLLAPAQYVLAPFIEPTTTLGITAYVIVTAALIGGLIRSARRSGLLAIHLVLGFYILVIVFWNYPQMRRFLLLFLPLFCVGLWHEANRLARLVRDALSTAHSAAQKASALILALALLGFIATVTYSYMHGHRLLRSTNHTRTELAAEKTEAYAWLRQHGVNGGPVIAYEDANLYLYTGHTAIRPIGLPSEVIYTPSRVRSERYLTRLTDVVRHVNARYWLTSEDDFANDIGRPTFARRAARLKSVLPEVFGSQNKRVKILDLTCVAEPEAPNCKSSNATIRRIILQREVEERLLPPATPFP